MWVSSKVRSAFNSTAVLGLTIIALIWGATLFHLREERRQALESSEQNVSNLSRSFEEHVIRSIEEVDKTLLLLRAAYERDPAKFDIVSFTSNPHFLNSLIFQVTLIGPDGYMVANNLGPPASPVDLRDREHYLVHLQRAADELFISKPVLGRASGKWSIQLTRRVSNRDGSFAGVLVASLDPYHFSRFYEAIDLGSAGTVTLVGTDGIIRAHKGGSGEFLGKSLAVSPLFKSLESASAGTYVAASALDHQDRLTAYRRVKGFPLVVSVSILAADIYAHTRAHVLLPVALALTALVAAGMATGARNRRRLQGARDAQRSSDEVARRKSAELEITLEHMSQGIMMVDTNRQVAVMNRQAGELLGLPEHLVHGRPKFDDLLEWQSRSGEFDGDTDLLAWVKKGGISDGPDLYQRTRPNGLVLEIRSTQLADGGVVRTYTDVTARAKSEAELAEARDRAEAASRARAMFLAMMSHEMRTPLNGVIGMASLLAATPLDAEQRRYASTMQESAEHLLQIINDVLDLSKLEADRLELREERFDVRKLAHGVLAMLAPAADKKGLFLGVMVEDHAPQWVTSDPAVLRQILLNLAGNAVKFTERGSVLIRIGLEGTEADRDRLAITVEDTGIGIAAEDIPLLFREFSQLGDAAPRSTGTGLGLAICRKLVDRLNGSVEVRSAPGHGSRFRFTARVVACEPAADASPLLGRKALVLAGDAGARACYGQALARAGATIEAASDAASAHAILAKTPVDTMIVDDAALPGALEQIAQAVRHLRPRMVLVTQSRPRETSPCGATPTADVVLHRPAEPDALVSAVQGHTVEPALAVDMPQQAAADAAGLSILIAEDNSTNRMVLEAMVRKLGHRATTAENGALAVEAVQAARYDLVFMDVMMPEMDGLEATRAIRALPGPECTTPIIGLTANALPENASAARAAGMDDVATKPITGQKVAALIERVSRRISLPIPAESSALNEFDAATLDRFVGELGESAAREIVGVFLRDTGSRIDEMARNRSNLTSLARDAHSIRSAAAALGLFGVSASAEALEASASVMSPQALAAAVAALRDAFGRARTALPESLRGAA